jgi:hypothetical protein
MMKILNAPVIGPFIGLGICLAVSAAFVLLLGGANLIGYLFYTPKAKN